MLCHNRFGSVTTSARDYYLLDVVNVSRIVYAFSVESQMIRYYVFMHSQTILYSLGNN